MNHWTELSVQFANCRNYLDELFRIYPISPNLRRDISEQAIDSIALHYQNRDNKELVKELLKLDLFPIKDSYVPFLRKSRNAIELNPNTVNRIAGNLYAMGLDVILDRCTEPKETNRQMGPMFKNWVKSGVLGCDIYEDEESFLASEGNAVPVLSDQRMKRFAIEHLGYTRVNKGLDFIARFNGKYVIAETKFITDQGGHQSDQFEDAMLTLTSPLDPVDDKTVITIIIADGVLYIPGNHKLYRYINQNDDWVILSALVLREYLYSL